VGTCAGTPEAPSRVPLIDVTTSDHVLAMQRTAGNHASLRKLASPELTKEEINDAALQPVTGYETFSLSVPTCRALMRALAAPNFTVPTEQLRLIAVGAVKVTGHTTSTVWSAVPPAGAR
jgi:hypothetical protein